VAEATAFRLAHQGFTSRKIRGGKSGSHIRVNQGGYQRINQVGKARIIRGAKQGFTSSKIKG
jgi:hypothetical protein